MTAKLISDDPLDTQAFLVDTLVTIPKSSKLQISTRRIAG